MTSQQVSTDEDSLWCSDHGDTELPSTPKTVPEAPVTPEQPASAELCCECNSGQLLTLEHLREAVHPLSVKQKYREAGRRNHTAQIFRRFPDLLFRCICDQKFHTAAAAAEHITALNDSKLGSDHIKSWGKAKGTEKTKNVTRT
ncbi:hypothetical protein MSAN_02485400 [Mycena sanguinolenta]|uniref:Uncharacterized protein n=1 Tax=Mycena sanguinolenta TaxID=230812 RepID=A0A8H6WSI1_9AGAR|nr:hypothetical protein MSAN_02485400 [Mycena sanguinolenta]